MENETEATIQGVGLTKGVAQRRVKWNIERKLELDRLVVGIISNVVVLNS